MDLHQSVGTDAAVAPAVVDGAFSEALQLCRQSLAQCPVDGPLKPLQGPIRVFAAAASQSEVAPEKLIAELKRILFELPHFTVRRATERGEMMHQLVTVAINAYYRRVDD